MKALRRGSLAATGLACALAIPPTLAQVSNLPNLGAARPSQPMDFALGIKEGLISAPQDGRLFVILSRTNNPEPRLTLGWTGLDAPVVLVRDLSGFAPGATATLGQHEFAFPHAKPNAVTPGDYCVQALFDSNTDLRSPNASGNLFSAPRTVHFDWARSETIPIELSQQIPPDVLPPDTESIKFIKLQSRLLSRFHGRPSFLRAGIILPRDYAREPSRRYPLWVRIGGLNARYTSVNRLMADRDDYKQAWLAPDTPPFILLQLDGAGPYGDPYYVNSANNGPYGDALVQELIPHVEAKFRAIGQPRARVLSGTSTGGWVALALQIFYPTLFNGTWASCPDPVDFRALQLVNLYADDNLYLDAQGNERPSARNLKGETTLTTQRELGVENLLGHGSSYTLSGRQWGAWNAVFSPRGTNGLPAPAWDPQTGKIHHVVTEQWNKYDLRLVLEQNWKTLAPKLRGKIHIASGEADQYFLNSAVHLLDQSLSHAQPPFEGTIVYGPGRGHGWSNLSTREMLAEMQVATGEKQ